jgi:peptidoglycan pentaglycine glycine transferase (the first glycine)
MQIRHVTPDRREEWNQFVIQEPSFALLQSWEWGEVKEKLGWEAIRIAVEQQGSIVAGAQMLVKYFPTRLASMAYIPRGPIGDWLNPEITAGLLSELNRVAHSHRAVSLTIEPPVLNNPTIDSLLREHGFRVGLQCNQPRSTIIMDLTPSLEDILAQMRKSTRRKVQSAARKGIVVRMGDRQDLPEFYRLMQITAQRAQFPVRSLDYYQQEWETLDDCKHALLLLAFYEDKPVAAHIAYAFGEHVAFFHQASSGEYGNLNPNSLLVWEQIKWAKSMGIRTYDFWGIPDEVGQSVTEEDDAAGTESTDGLWGPYRFKRGFSKNIVCYAGAYDRFCAPMLGQLVSTSANLLKSDAFDRAIVWLDTVRHT